MFVKFFRTLIYSFFFESDADFFQFLWNFLRLFFIVLHYIIRQRLQNLKKNGENFQKFLITLFSKSFLFKIDKISPIVGIWPFVILCWTDSFFDFFKIYFGRIPNVRIFWGSWGFWDFLNDFDLFDSPFDRFLFFRERKFYLQTYCPYSFLFSLVTVSIL